MDTWMDYEMFDLAWQVIYFKMINITIPKGGTGNLVSVNNLKKRTPQPQV